MNTTVWFSIKYHDMNNTTTRISVRINATIWLSIRYHSMFNITKRLNVRISKQFWFSIIYQCLISEMLTHISIIDRIIRIGGRVDTTSRFSISYHSMVSLVSF